MSEPSLHAHILHVSGHLAGEPLAFLSQATRELACAGIGQTVLHPGAEPSAPAPNPASLPERVRLVELCGAAPGPLTFARDLPAALQDELDSGRYAAVHFHGPLVGLIGGIAMATAALPKRRPPVYYSPHTPLSPAGLLQRAVGALVLHPVASGAAEALQLRRLTRREAFALETAVDPEYFDVRPARGAQPLVVAIGHARADSGAELFAELAVRFHFAGEAVRFVWIGPCEPAARDLLVAAGVHITGWLPEAEVRAWLARAHVYVQASRWRKTPRALLQAMACGVPCLATDVPAHREALRHGETGCLGVDASELVLQLKALLCDPGMSRHIGEAARHEAHLRFTLPRLRQSLLKLYGLASGRPPSPAWLPEAALASGH